MPWPDTVTPEQTPGWTTSAARWLLTLAPGYDHPVLRAQPLLLAHAACWTITGLLDGTRAGYGYAPGDLGDHADADDVGHLQGLYRRNGDELEVLLAEVTAVRDALIRDAHRRAHEASRIAEANRRPRYEPNGNWRRHAKPADGGG